MTIFKGLATNIIASWADTDKTIDLTASQLIRIRDWIETHYETMYEFVQSGGTFKKEAPETPGLTLSPTELVMKIHEANPDKNLTISEAREILKKRRRNPCACSKGLETGTKTCPSPYSQ